ncbi:MAG: exodeoxyribonuclease VII large subunit [Methylococcaceae bacterium]|jgi:exodeoxyribonuclease VII large subunit
MSDLLPITASNERVIYSVSRLNRVCRFLLNDTFSTLWIEGELSNFSAPSSGHLYFTLKDAEAQVRCAMFRPQTRSLGFRPQNGDHVLARAQVSLYEPRGDFQLIVETLEAAGDGVLALAFERLKQKLEAEGLFSATHKQPIPAFPACIGVITSPTGAAIRDILSVLARRFPRIEVILFPVKVQGAEAAAEIVRAFRLADQMQCCDVLIVGRGGGAGEDLWCFNDEAVARAIHACRTPVVSAVGHETDFTISDFVADLRAPTPSAAAEAISPNRVEWLGRLDRLSGRLRQSLLNHTRQLARRIEFLEIRLRQLHPAQRLMTQSQRLDELEQRLVRAIRHPLTLKQTRLQTQKARLQRQHPDHTLTAKAKIRDQLEQRLRTAMQRRLDGCQQALGLTSQSLNTVSPLATLTRGYSITTLTESGALILRCSDAAPGSSISTRVNDGTLHSIVLDSCANKDASSL